jgi:tetratricopeptide (TPR) repeat protein
MSSQRKSSVQRRLILALVAFTASLVLVGPASAGPQVPAPATQATAPEQSAATVGTDTVITIHADKSAETVETMRIRILGASAVQSEGQQSLQYIDGLQTLDVEAYTEKPDGTKIPVDPATILTHDAATGLTAVYLRDAKVRTVLFNNVAVGDTLVIKSVRVEKSGMFAGQFNKVTVFPLNMPWVDSKITVVAPKDISANVGVYGEHLDHQVIDDGNTTRHVVFYHPQRRTTPEAGATSLLDRDPRVIISTFASYEQLGRDYWAAVANKAVPTKEIIDLAEQITTGIADRRAQAEAIDHWIKQNIRYVGVYLGTGRVIANDPATVLKNRYGDCKDHATLMTTLLAAKGIVSEDVLINLGDIYTLPAVVAPGYFNHMMIYLPEFSLYDDPTASFAPFGVLARQSYDKPVLRISAQGAHLAHTPAMQAAEHVTTTRTRIAIAADGAVGGETWNSATGANAGELRSAALKLQSIGLETAAERILQLLGNPGKGRYEIGAPLDGAHEYTVGGRFTLNGRLNVAPGAVLGVPRGMDLLATSRPGAFLFGALLPSRQTPFVCSAGRQIEDIEISFADGLPLPSAPKGIKIDRPQFTYMSAYRIEGRTLKIRREFESRVAGQVCAPETEAAIAEPLKAVQADLATGMSIPTPAVAKIEPPKPQDALLTNRSQCSGFDNASADLRIGACTALIQSGQEPQPALAVTFVNRGLAYRTKGDNARAAEDFDQAIKLLPNYAVAFNARGLIRSSMRDYDAAIADFDEAVRLNPTFANAFVNRGTAYWDKGARDAAMADFNQATALDPINAYAFQTRGRAYRIAGEFERAITDFDQVIRLQRNNAAAWNERCYTHLVANATLSAALADCNESLRLNPKFGPALGNRALVLLRDNEIDRAIVDYNAALQVAPKYATALYGRGVAKLKKGDSEGGNADIAAATAIDPNVAKEFARLGVTVATKTDQASKSVL